MTLFFLSSFPPDNVVSRDRFVGPVPRQPPGYSPHSRLNVMLTYGNPPHTKNKTKKLEHKNFCSPHTVQLVRRANCPCCSRVTCLRTGELCISFLWLLDHFLLLLHFVLLTDAATVLVLYCRFLEKKRTHEDLLSNPVG